MRRILLLVFYAILFMIIGRNLSFLPHISFPSVKGASYLPKEIKEMVTKYLTTQKGTVSMYYKDLKSGEEFGIDENKQMTGASLNKLVIVSYLYHLAGMKKIDLEDNIAIQEKDIQDYGTGSLRYEKPGKSYTLKTLSKLTLEQSDNTAAHVLSIRLGKNNIQAYADEIGLASTHMEDNKTTARDMAKLLEFIYNKTVTTTPLTAELMDFLKDTDFEDRLARNISENAVVYHKTGDAVRMIHDVGIITDQENAFILAVLTSDMADEEHAREVIGELAEKIYYGRRN